MEQERREKKLAAARERQREELEGGNSEDTAEVTALTDAVDEDADVVSGEMESLVEGIAGTREGEVVDTEGYKRAAKPRPKRDPSEKRRMGA